MKVVSVIVAGRNCSPWLPQCLRSIAAQQLPPGWRARILLGVDACAATLRTALAEPIPGLEVYLFRQHVGPFVIFNSLAGIHPADALARFDADDVMLPGYLFAQLECLADVSRLIITQTWSVYVDAQLHPYAARLANGSVTRADGCRTSGSDGQFLMTRAVWERLGGFRAWWCHADAEFMRRAIWAGVARETLPYCLYLRRMHPKSLTQDGALGYHSAWRRHYARHIAEAVSHYARGLAPERIPRSVAPWVRYPSGYAAGDAGKYPVKTGPAPTPARAGAFL